MWERDETGSGQQDRPIAIPRLFCGRHRTTRRPILPPAIVLRLFQQEELVAGRLRKRVKNIFDGSDIVLLGRRD